MNSKSILTKTIFTFCVSALLLLQPAFAQIAKPKQSMTSEQIKAFLQEAKTKKWQVTVTTANREYNGVVFAFDGPFVVINQKHSLQIDIGSCSSGIPTSGPTNVVMADLITARKLNPARWVLLNTGEASLAVSLSALFIALAVVTSPISATARAIQKD